LKNKENRRKREVLWRNSEKSRVVKESIFKNINPHTPKKKTLTTKNSHKKKKRFHPVLKH